MTPAVSIGKHLLVQTDSTSKNSVDTNLRAYFVIDASGSMNFHSPGQDSKIQYARRIAASLAYLLVNQGDAAGLSICTDKLHFEVPPSRRAAHLERFFSTIEKSSPLVKLA